MLAIKEKEKFFMSNNKKYTVYTEDSSSSPTSGQFSELFDLFHDSDKSKKGKKKKKNKKKYNKKHDAKKSKGSKKSKKSKKQAEWKLAHKIIKKTAYTTLETTSEVVKMSAESKFFPNGRNSDSK